MFCSGIFLAVAAHVALVELSNTIWIQIAVSVIGIALMTLLANYRSWCNEVDKKPAKGFTNPMQAPPHSLCISLSRDLRSERASIEDRQLSNHIHSGSAVKSTVSQVCGHEASSRAATSRRMSSTA